MVYCVSRQRRALLLASPLLLVPAVWAKYWVFALFAYVALTPLRAWRYVSHGMSPARIALVVLATAVLLGLLTNTDFQQAGYYPLLALWYLVIPWRAIRRPMVLCWLLLPPLLWLLCRIEPVAQYTTGGMTSAFGTGYAAIGWHKWLRNLLNLPLVLMVGLGLPACIFIPAGLRALARERRSIRAWLCLAPVPAFALFMVFLSPVTYYRHYLPLLPAAALLAALGLFATRRVWRPWFMAFFFLWPALLAVDLVGLPPGPEVALRQWFGEHPGAPVFYSYYVNPPPAAIGGLFRPEYAAGDAAPLRQARYLVLSENWYDTAFANELNGPLVDDLSRLVKTRPQYARFYRDALAGRHPHLVEEASITVHNFMPELLLHRWLYGTFQLFVGDLKIFRVLDSAGESGAEKPGVRHEQQAAPACAFTPSTRTPLRPAGLPSPAPPRPASGRRSGAPGFSPARPCADSSPAWPRGQQEVPVQGGEGAGAIPAALRRVVAAILAMGAHALDVLARGDVGLAGHQAAVGVLAHTQAIG